MKLSSADPVDMYEAVAAEWLLHQGEVTLGDRCDELDAVSDAVLADQAGAPNGSCDLARAFLKLAAIQIDPTLDSAPRC